MDPTRQLAFTLELAEVYLRNVAAANLSWDQMRAVAWAVEFGLEEPVVEPDPLAEPSSEAEEEPPVEEDSSSPDEGLVSFGASVDTVSADPEVMIYGEDVVETPEVDAVEDQGDEPLVLELGSAPEDLGQDEAEVVAFEEGPESEPAPEDDVVVMEDDDLFPEDDDLDGPIFEDGDDDTPIFEDGDDDTPLFEDDETPAEPVETLALGGGEEDGVEVLSLGGGADEGAEVLSLGGGQDDEGEVLALGAMTDDDADSVDVMVLGEASDEVEVLAVEGLEAFEDDGSDDGVGGDGLQIKVHRDDPFETEEEASADAKEASKGRSKKRSKAAEAKLVARICKKAAKTHEAGDMSSAAEMYTDALDIDPDHVLALVRRARIYLDLGEYTRSMSDFARAEGLAPHDAEPHVGIGDLFFARKDYGKAISSYDTAIEHTPDHAMAHCRRGLAWYYRRKYPEALEDLERAQELDEDLPNIDTLLDMARKRVR